MQCWNCLAEIEPGAAFCANCGIDIVNPKANSSRLVMCPTCNDSFPESQLDSSGLTGECPECRRRAEEERLAAEEKKQEQQQKYSEGERADLRNQRNAVRFEVDKCFVRVTRLGLTAKILRKDQNVMGPLLDLSLTGLQCESEGEFESGDHVSIRLLVPAFKEPLNLAGEVRWAEAADAGHTRIGVRFDKTDANTLKHLRALEDHKALREAARLREEALKKASSAAMAKVNSPPAPKRDRPADF